jgi:hypothetical protein
MTTLGTTLDEILKQIQISDEERDIAIDRHKDLRDKLDPEIGSKSLIIGSYKKHTGVQPLHDVDVLVWLSKEFGGFSSITKIDEVDTQIVLEDLKKEVKNLGIDHKRIRIQNHSIGIFYEDDDLTIDLIPAFSSVNPSGDLDLLRKFRIPERETGKWIATNPEEDRNRLSKENTENNQKIVPSIKLLKRWRNVVSTEKAPTLKSFHIEALYIYLGRNHADIFDTGKSMFNVFKESILEINKIIESNRNIGRELGLEINPASYLIDNSGQKERIIRKLKALNEDLEEIEKLFNDEKEDLAEEKLKLIFSEQDTSMKTQHTKVSSEASNKRFAQLT